MTTSDQALISQYSDIPLANVPGRIILVFLNRKAEQARSDRRYIVQLAVEVTAAKTRQDYLDLVRNTFRELSLQPVQEISFLLPRLATPSTELQFDESTTWYRLGPAALESLDHPPSVLGVQCRTLFEQPQKQTQAARDPAPKSSGAPVEQFVLLFAAGFLCLCIIIPYASR